MEILEIPYQISGIITGKIKSGRIVDLSDLLLRKANKISSLKNCKCFDENGDVLRMKNLKLQ